MLAQSCFAELSGTRLYYEVARDGQPLVLIHGFGLDLRMWDDQFTALARRFQVIRYDVRGFGKPTLPTHGPYTHANDLKGLLAHLALSQAHIIGLSMGGVIAISFALTYPNMVRSLILADTALNGYQFSQVWTAQWDRIAAEARSHGPKGANQLLLGHPLFAAARENAAVASRLTQIINDYSGWHWINNDEHSESELPDQHRLNLITVPTLIIVGQRDLPDFQAIAALLQERIPRASTVQLAQVGHMANMEAPVQFNDLVETFLGSA